MDDNYYKNQLDRLKDLEAMSIVLVDFAGNKTNYMNLNSESIEILIDFLNKLKEIQND